MSITVDVNVNNGGNYRENAFFSLLMLSYERRGITAIIKPLSDANIRMSTEQRQQILEDFPWSDDKTINEVLEPEEVKDIFRVWKGSEKRRTMDVILEGMSFWEEQDKKHK